MPENGLSLSPQPPPPPLSIELPCEVLGLSFQALNPTVHALAVTMSRIGSVPDDSDFSNPCQNTF